MRDRVAVADARGNRSVRRLDVVVIERHVDRVHEAVDGAESAGRQGRGAAGDLRMDSGGDRHGGTPRRLQTRVPTTADVSLDLTTARSSPAMGGNAAQRPVRAFVAARER